MGGQIGGTICFRFQKGGPKRNKAGMRGDQKFKREKRVVLGAKTKNNALLTILCNNNCLIFKSRQNIINEQNF